MPGISTCQSRHFPPRLVRTLADLPFRGSRRTIQTSSGIRARTSSTEEASLIHSSWTGKKTLPSDPSKLARSALVNSLISSPALAGVRWNLNYSPEDSERRRRSRIPVGIPRRDWTNSSPTRSWSFFRSRPTTVCCHVKIACHAEIRCVIVINREFHRTTKANTRKRRRIGMKLVRTIRRMKWNLNRKSKVKMKGRDRRSHIRRNPFVRRLSEQSGEVGASRIPSPPCWSLLMEIRGTGRSNGQARGEGRSPSIKERTSRVVPSRLPKIRTSPIRKVDGLRLRSLKIILKQRPSSVTNGNQSTSNDFLKLSKINNSS